MIGQIEKAEKSEEKSVEKTQLVTTDNEFTNGMGKYFMYY